MMSQTSSVTSSERVTNRRRVLRIYEHKDFKQDISVSSP